MNNKTVNWVVLILVAFGLVFLVEYLISLSDNQRLTLIAKTVKYGSIPLGLAIKAYGWVRDKQSKLEEIRNIALTNKGNDDSLKEQIRFIRDDYVGLRSEFNDSMTSLDRRMIRLEAKSELATKLERHERLLSELNDRLNKLSD